MHPTGTAQQHRPTQDGGRRGHRGLAISALAFALLILVAGAAVLLSLRQSISPAHRSTEQHSYQGLSRLTLDVGSGNVRVRAGEAGSRTVTVVEKLAWNRQRPTVERRHTGDALTVRPRCASDGLSFGFRTCRADLTVTVPADLSLNLLANSGDIGASGLSGPVLIRATSGDVTLDELSGPVAVKLDSGNVGARNLRSHSVRVSASSGDVKLGFRSAPDTVDVAVSSGNTHVQVPHESAGYQVSSTVSSGDSSVGVHRSTGSPHRITLRASSGDIRVDYTS